MTEAQGEQIISLLQEISSKLDTIQSFRSDFINLMWTVIPRINTIDFYFGIITGALIGLVFWNVAKGVSQ